MILPGYANSDVGPWGSNVSFSIDGAPVHAHINIPRVGDLPREELVFNATNLTSGNHELVMQANPYVINNDMRMQSISIFDRAVYTYVYH